MDSGVRAGAAVNVTAPGRVPVWTAVLAAAAFLFHAANYLYFFVDDEGIPFMYARNLVRGRGLVYSAVEGKVEGYSDFLMVIVDAVTYTIVRIAHLPLFSVFASGELISLPCGAAIVWLLTRFFQRNYRSPAAAAGTLLVVLAGPLAVWSCSSLETAPFALAFTVFTLGLLERRWTAAAVAAIVLLLLRIDAPVYLAAGLACGLLPASAGDRRTILRRVVVPLIAVAAVYHAWRVLYFHRLLTTPLEAKVMYKLTGPSHAITKAPDENYLLRFIRLYGAVFVGAAALGWIALRRTPRATGVLVAASILCAYVAVVSDWMFGFRFLVPVVPLLAIMTAETVEGVTDWHRAAGVVAACASIVWVAHVAAVFGRSFEDTERDPKFIGSPSRDPARFFSPWWFPYAALRDRVAPGTAIAYHQAGFVPFMLDAENIDTLGICSRFYAELPTQDVFYTEVGRYSPLTNKDVYSAGLAYVLNRRPAYLIERADLLGKANGGIPEELLGGYYRRVSFDQSNAIYVPTERDPREFRTDPTRFLENVAHVARVSRVVENGATVPPSEYADRFQFLHEQRSVVRFDGSHYSLDLRFETGPVPVFEIHIEAIRSSVEATAVVTLWSSTGERVHQVPLALPAGVNAGMHVRLGQPVTAARATLEVATRASGPCRLHVDDLRVQAQPPELARYIAAHVRFER
jgi:hypothetical protein